MHQETTPYPTLESFFAKNGALRKNLERFEYRPDQEKMAKSVEAAWEKGSNLIVEAGTGTGKSFAYLIPSILWAVKNGKRVCVSTFTKTLQQQLIEKDLPFISKALGIDFQYSLCIGANNYLCKRRLYAAKQTSLFTDWEEVRQTEKLFEWDQSTKSGSRLDLPFQPLPSVWDEVGKHRELCLGKKCLYQGNCFYNLARKEWMTSQLLVANHHLFFANLASNSGVLPPFHAVVFDEAHNMEDVATSYLGVEVSNSGLRYFLDRIHNPKTGKGFLSRTKGVKQKAMKVVSRAIAETRNISDIFFSELSMRFENSYGAFRLREPDFIVNTLHDPIRNVCREMKALKEHLKDDDEANLEAGYFTECLEDFAAGLNAVISQSLDDHVYWLETAYRKRYTKLSLMASPVEIASLLREAVFDKEEPAALTSATLSTNSSFDYISSRLGLEDSDKLIFPSPFRFDRQTLLFTVKDFPDPSQKPGEFLEASVQKIKELLKAGSGRAFVLFTSYSMLNKVHQELSGANLPWRLIKQGEMPQARAIEIFKEEPESVILGTNSFWEGVDVPGEALQSVIITKLPFAVPTEPLIEARIERLKAEGREPFFEFQIPRAIVMLKQGFGRLIRHMEDLGMVAILDPRVHTKGYGKMFLNSLPECIETREMEEVKRFFDKIRKAGRG